tara:strand:- start:591 stop:932 length:342 start_codon:yes stop_codon:yes gene_type:complete
MGRIGQKVKKGAKFGAKVVGGAILGVSVLAGSGAIGMKSTGDGSQFDTGAPELPAFNRRVPRQEPVGNLFQGIASGVGGRHGDFLAGAESEFDDFGAFSLKKGGRVRKYKKHC